MKITVLDGYGLNPGDLSWKDLEKLGELKVYERTSPAELLDRAKDSEILITNKTLIDAQALNELPKLKYIGVLATGYNVVDVEEARKWGVTVTNIPAYSTMSVAQHVFALLLAVTDSVEHYTSEVKAGKWVASKDFCFWNTPLTELCGKTMGIVGMGNIGSAVARIALAFGMKVVAVTSKTSGELPQGVEKVNRNDLFNTSDVISLHCPLTENTKEMINSSTLSMMKQDVILINTGRGGLINEKDVADALSEGRIGAYCTDVLCKEPAEENNPLLSAPNLYITPHIAWATKEARVRLMDIAVKNLEAFLSGHPQNVV